jgi:hypothetical protein
MYIIFFILSGLLYAHWIWGMSKPKFNTPWVYQHKNWAYYVFGAATLFAIIGYLIA